jgi:hypothetical protein
VEFSKNNSVIFSNGPVWEESVASAIKDTPNILQKIKEFRDLKSQNPLARFGSNDKSFATGGVYKKYLPKALKAHLTNDISIIYELSGKDPTKITLYGVFTHSQLGIDQTPNHKIQKNMAKKLAREDLENFLKKLILT